jgi:hypothetical protein
MSQLTKKVVKRVHVILVSFGSTTFGITTLCMMAFNILALNIKGIICDIQDKWHSA